MRFSFDFLLATRTLPGWRPDIRCWAVCTSKTSTCNTCFRSRCIFVGFVFLHASIVSWAFDCRRYSLTSDYMYVSLQNTQDETLPNEYRNRHVNHQDWPLFFFSSHCVARFHGTFQSPRFHLNGNVHLMHGQKVKNENDEMHSNNSRIPTEGKPNAEMWCLPDSCWTKQLLSCSTVYCRHCFWKLVVLYLYRYWLDHFSGYVDQ
jgi:hypothetical protein